MYAYSQIKDLAQGGAGAPPTAAAGSYPVKAHFDGMTGRARCEVISDSYHTDDAVGTSDDFILRVNRN